jgi:hypothetical protein
MNEDNRREDHWHTDKKVPVIPMITTILGWLATILVLTVMGAQFKTEVTEFMRYSDDRMLKLEESIKEDTKDRIYRKTVEDMFQPRDVEREMIRESLTDIKRGIEKVSSDMTQLRRDLTNGAK